MSSLNSFPLFCKCSRVMTKCLFVSSSSAGMKKCHCSWLNLTAMMASAFVLCANCCSSMISFLSKYWLLPLQALHSIASLFVLLAAITSGAGYFIEPDPATLHAAHSSVCQNKCISSRSASHPLLFLLI